VADADVRALVHELQVCQIELEMQNEELARAHVAAKELAEKYHELFDFAPTGYFLFGEQGQIQEVNLAGAALLGRDRGALVNRRFGRFVAAEDRQKFARFCEEVVNSAGKRSVTFRLFEGQRTVHVMIEGRASRGAQEQTKCWHAAVSDIGALAQATDVLRASEERYRALVEGVNVGIALIDSSRNILMINRNHADFVGRSPEELVGKKCYREVEGREAICSHCPGTTAMASGRPAEVEISGLLKNGNPFSVNLKASPVFDASGQAVGFIELIEDIRGRKEQEENTSRLATFPAENPNPIVRIRGDGTVLYSNQPGTQLLSTWGCREGETLPDPWHGYVLDAINSGEIRKTECHCGSQVFSLTFAPIANAGYVNLYAMDVTERRRAEDNVRRAEQEKAAILNGMSDVIVQYVDPDLRIIWANAATRELAGDPAESLVGKHCYRVLHGLDGPCPDCTSVRACKTGKPEEGEVTTPDGQAWMVRSNPLKDGAGRVMGVVCIAVDITERKQAEARLFASEARYRKLFEEATEGVVIADAETGTILDCNQAILQLTGYDRAELIGRPQTVLHPPEEGRPPVSRTFAYHRREKDGAVLPAELLTKDGSLRHVEIKGNVVEIDGWHLVQGFFRDVTAEARYRREREMTLSLLRLLNDDNPTRELVRNLTGLLRQWTGCEAVRVRLRDVDSFPHFETQGFPLEFAGADRPLCLQDRHGDLVRNACGDPVLECMCGNVLCRRFNAALPFFTPKGSFWTNSAGELLAARNRCNATGYESVALIALCHGNETLGLLQFNDRVKNRFTPELIADLERAADQIAMALAQRQSHAALQKSAQGYRSLFDNMLNGFAYCRMLFEDGRPQDFVYLAVNNAFETLTGLKNVVGKRVSEILPGLRNSNPELLELYGRVASTGVPERIETYVGALEMWFSVAVYSPGKDHFVAVFDVITDRKRAEETVRENEERLRFALETSHTGAWDLDLGDHTAHRSLEHDRIFGYAQLLPQWTYEMFLDHVLPEDRGAVNSKFRHALETRDDWNFECRIRRPDGEVRWILAAGRHRTDAAGLPRRMAGIVRDVTERKHAELRIRHLNEVLRAIRDIGELIARERNRERLLGEACTALLRTRGYRLVWVGGLTPESKRVVRIAGAGAALDYLDEAHITWDESETGRGPIGTALRTRETCVCQDTATDPAFAPWREAALACGYRSVAAVPMIHHGRLFGAVSVYADLPAAFDEEELRLLNELAGDLAFALQTIEDEEQKKRVEQDLIQAKIAAEGANRAKSEFLANMSHEIRTPMTAILGFSEFLRAPNRPAQEQRDCVEGIHRNAGLLLQLISDILDLSKIEAGRLTVDPVPCCPRQVAEDVVAMLAERASHKGIALQLGYQPALFDTVHTDPIRLRQILVNLIGNAIKFTERGHVWVSLRSGQQQGRQQLVFEVSDTGIGIPADRICQLFKPFSQVDASATRRYGGTGLGLALAQRLAKALGGDITVASQEGQGSTFTLTVDAGPAVEELRHLPPARKPAADTAKPPAKSCLAGRLLLVEDNCEVQLAMKYLLHSLNLETDMADNGEIGCQRAKQSLLENRPYALILMDIQMPVLNGLEATARLRQEGWTGAIVALTAHAMTGDRERCLEAGCDDYVSKPVSQRTLETLLERFCRTNAAAVPPDDGRRPSADGGGLREGDLLAPEQVTRLIEQYAAELPARTGAIDTALGRGDFRTVATLAHALKGSAGTYGFATIADAARRLYEEASCPDDVKAVETAVLELQALCRQTIDGVSPARPAGRNDMTVGNGGNNAI
jgi:PAS domain S-box-containing protein